MEGLISKVAEYKIAVTFVDDMDFILEEEDSQQKIQIILDKYTRLFQATGGVVEPQKINYFCQKWIRRNRQLTIYNINTTLEINEEIINQKNVNDAIRIYGVHV